jgi:arylsulfatase A-like enzyme
LDVNFMKRHNPTNAAPKFAGKSRLGDYSDSLIELDDNIGRIMDAIRAEAPDTIVVITADNGAWQDAYPVPARRRSAARRARPLKADGGCPA